MKRVYLTLALISLIGLGTAVVGGPNASDNEVAITSGSSASASTSVGPNGTEYSTSIENLNNSCVTGDQSIGLDFVGFQGDGNMTELSFEGTLETSNPCTELALEAEEVSENSYRVEVVEKSTGRGPCVQCVGGAEVTGTFSAPGEYKVEFMKGNESLGVRETSGYEESQKGEETGGEKRRSGLHGLINWFSSLFQ